MKKLFARELALALVVCAFALLIAPVAFAQVVLDGGGYVGGSVSIRDRIVGWCLDHPLEAVGLVIYILLNLVNKLSAYPRARGLVAVLKVLIDYISIVPHRDSPGIFALPFTRSAPPADAEPMTLSAAAAPAPDARP